jgi:hypothetical protein
MTDAARRPASTESRSRDVKAGELIASGRSGVCVDAGKGAGAVDCCACVIPE